MSVVAASTDHLGIVDGQGSESYVQASAQNSPFAAARIFEIPAEAATVAPTGYVALASPFAESLASLDEAELEAQAFDTLRAEFEDEEFRGALEALADEVAGRHITAGGSWGQTSESPTLSSTEAEAWMESLAARSDELFNELAQHFGDRPGATIAPGELEAVAGHPGVDREQHLMGPIDAQEMFLGKLIGKVVKVVKGVSKVVSKLVPLGKVFGFLKKLVRPLLQRVLQKAIGKLPTEVRAHATRLAAKFGKPHSATDAKDKPGTKDKPSTKDKPDQATAVAPADTVQPGAGADAAPAATEPAPADAPASGESPWSTEALADEFDARLAEAVLAPNESNAEQLLAEFEYEVRTTELSGAGPVADLDAARQRLAHQLVSASPGHLPTAEMEEFVPIIFAAMKLIKLGVKVIGRRKVVDFIAKLLATLIQGTIGEPAVKALSRPIADVGLRLLGLEAERPGDPTLGAQALVATAEDTVREVAALPEASLNNELLLEAAVQEAFAAAAARHFPAEVLRPDLNPAEAEGERGIWLMFPRGAGPHYRYKKFTVLQRVRLTRPMARAVIYADGDTLENRLLDAGARAWPIHGEVHYYELLPGAQLGHLAAFEAADEGGPAGPDGHPAYSEVAAEFEELSRQRPLPFAHPVDHRPTGGAASGPRPGAPARTLQPGARLFRVLVPGLRLRPRPPFALRLDLSGARPHLRVHLRIGERLAHELVEHLHKHEHVKVVNTIRERVGGPARQALAAGLHRMLARRDITLPEGASARIADALAEAIARSVAQQLPAAAAALTAAAKDPAAGVTLTFAFAFADKAALVRGHIGDPTLSIHPGVVHRD